MGDELKDSEKKMELQLESIQKERDEYRKKYYDLKSKLDQIRDIVV